MKFETENICSQFRVSGYKRRSDIEEVQECTLCLEREHVEPKQCHGTLTQGHEVYQGYAAFHMESQLEQSPIRYAKGSPHMLLHYTLYFSPSHNRFSTFVYDKTEKNGFNNLVKRSMACPQVQARGVQYRVVHEPKCPSHVSSSPRVGPQGTAPCAISMSISQRHSKWLGFRNVYVCSYLSNGVDFMWFS